MQDTSFAIHPDRINQSSISQINHIGQYKSHQSGANFIEISCSNGYVNFQFYKPDILRITMNPFQQPDMSSSVAIVKEAETVNVQMSEDEVALVLKTETLTVRLQKAPFRVLVLDKEGALILSEDEKGMAFDEENRVLAFKKKEENDHFYGFGEKAGFLDKKEEKLTMWNTDVYAPHNPETDSLYQSIPYFMGLRDGRAYGVYFDNTFKTTFDMKSENEHFSFSSEGGQLDYFIMAGPSPKDVLGQYTELTGKMPLPPKWALGYHQSRYSYETEQEVRALASLFQARGIPIDAIHLDIHYMDGYRVFTFDEDRFPNPEGMVSDLKKMGIHIVPIVDAGVKVDENDSTYSEGLLQDLFCKYSSGELFFGDVWPGKSAFPDFTMNRTRKWWGNLNRFYTDLGIDGIWNDMNEPAVFNETKTMDLEAVHENEGNPKLHRELHNVYGMLMEASTYEGMKTHLEGKRPFVLTRAGFAGIQRYAAVWTGDNRSFWEHLAMTLPMCMNLGVSGVALCGSDIGGFAHDSSGELLVRWTQVGAFLPYFRNHSALDTKRQEPWAFGEKYESIMRKYIQLRYKWLPHLYNLFRETTVTGVPVMRPLFMEYPNDPDTYNLSDQFMIGSNVLIAPVLSPNSRHRAIYLPAGQWYDYWTDQKYDGGQHQLIEADLETLPIFIKAGTFLFEGDVIPSAAIASKTLKIHVYPNNNSFSTVLYEDDGESFAYADGESYSELFFCQYNGESLKLKTGIENDRFQPGWTHKQFNIHDILEETEVLVNGIRVPVSIDAAGVKIIDM